MYKTNKLSLSFLVFVLLALVASMPAVADSDSDSDSDIVGSWIGTSTLDGVPGSAPLLATFNEDGTFFSSGPSAFNSLAHGAWKEDSGSFATTSTFLVYDDTTGDAVARLTSVATTEVDGDTASATFSAQLEDLSGAPLGPPLSGSLSLTRIQVP